MRPRYCQRAERALIVIAACALSGFLPAAWAEDRYDETTVPPGLRTLEEIVTWRVEFDNDVIFDSDNQFTNGCSLQKFGPPTHSWHDAGGTPAFGKGMAEWFLPERRTDLFFREGWIIGQNMQTPEDLSREDLIVDDVPYAASLAVQNTWIAYDDREFHGFGWLLGMVGPLALGEEVQNGFHELVGADDPRGWDNQLRNEPVLNLYYQRKRKLWRSPVIDIAVGLGAQAGNFLTSSDLSIETRFGWHLPRGFIYIPDPVGRSLSYDSHLAPRKPIRWACYASVVVRGSAVAHVLFLDGNTFRDSHSVEREPLAGELIVGLHYQRWRWGIHLHMWFTTDTVDPAVIQSQPHTTNDFGSFMIEFRF